MYRYVEKSQVMCAINFLNANPFFQGPIAPSSYLKRTSFGCRAIVLLKASKKNVLMKDDMVLGLQQLPQLTSLL